MIVKIIVGVFILGLIGYGLIKLGVVNQSIDDSTNFSGPSSPPPLNSGPTEPPPSDSDNIETDTAVPQVKFFEMQAKQWEFVPKTITVNQGDTVKLKIESTDVAHGFLLKEFAVDVKFNAGEKVEVEFVADKKGIFIFSCHVFCGTDHGKMKGTLIVQ